MSAEVGVGSGVAVAKSKVGVMIGTSVGVGGRVSVGSGKGVAVDGAISVGVTGGKVGNTGTSGVGVGSGVAVGTNSELAGGVAVCTRGAPRVITGVSMRAAGVGCALGC